MLGAYYSTHSLIHSSLFFGNRVRKLSDLQRELEVATVRRPLKDPEELEECVVEMVLLDTNMRQGPSAIKSRLKNKKVLVTRCVTLLPSIKA